MEASTEVIVSDCYKLFGYSWDECGYCHGDRPCVRSESERSLDQNGNSKEKRTYRSYYAQVTSKLKPSSYEALMCRGWRRSGTIIYLPNNAVTCCPQHTIRLPLVNYQPNKEHKKVLRKIQSLLQGKKGAEKRKKQRTNDAVMGFLAGNGTLSALVQETETHLAPLIPAEFQEPIPRVRYKIQHVKHLTACVSCPICTALVSRKIIEKKDANTVANILVQRLQSSENLKNRVASISCTTSGILLMEVQIPDEIVNTPPTSDLLASWFESKGLPVPTDRTVKIKTLPATESATSDPRVHQLYWDYQAAVHGDKHPLRGEDATDGRSSPTMVDPRARAMLQRSYQGRPIPFQAFSSFWDFLVDSPLGEASIHQQYTIGDAMVAVGVLDILPTGISSVYCFYDPSFSKLVKLGTYVALKEIEYTRSLQLPYYYLGYYIESNPKMNYKGDFVGSQIRCSITGEWVSVEHARPVLRQDERAKLGSGCQPQSPRHQHLDVGTIPLLSPQGVVFGNQLHDDSKEYVYPFLEEWSKLVGREIATTGTIDMIE